MIQYFMLLKAHGLMALPIDITKHRQGEGPDFTVCDGSGLFGVVFGGSDAQPVTVALNNLVNTSTGVKEYNVDMAAAIIAALPTLGLYLVAGKYFVRGLTAGAVKG